MRPATCALAAMLGAATLVACGSALPTTNSPATTTASPSQPQPATFVGNFSGIVRIDGVPVAGAEVTVVADGMVVKEALSTTSDRTGHYAFESVRATKSAPLLSAYRPGFFIEAHWAPGVGDQIVDFDLSPARAIEAGAGVRSGTPNGMCEGVGYGRVPCHRFAVVATAGGILQATIVAGGSSALGDIDVWGPRGVSNKYVPCPCPSPFTFSFDVENGQTYEIRVTEISSLGFSTAITRRR